MSNPEGSQVVVGNYEIIKRIATGGMAEIYLAWQHGPGGFRRQVVLKRIHPHLAMDPEFVEMFQNEARLAASLSHPNIIHIYELLEDEGGDMYIVMEYVRGESVQTMLRALRQMRMSLPVPYAVQIALQVCEALDHAHTSVGPDLEPQPIVHRDVSPSNIHVSMKGQIKLLDFGIAKALARVDATQGGKLKGKYSYMSPEQIRGDQIDSRTDVFSLGVVLWELTTGRRLFRGNNELAIIKAVLNEPIPSPSTVAKDFPMELEPIIMRCLERDRGRRYATARAVATDLDEKASANDWTMKTMTLGALMKVLFGDKVETSSPASGETSVPSSVNSGVLVRRSGPPPSISAPPPSPAVNTHTQPSAEWGSAPPPPPPSVGVKSNMPPSPLAAPILDPSLGVAPRRGVLEGDRLIIALFELVIAASVLFWALIFPQLQG